MQSTKLLPLMLVMTFFAGNLNAQKIFDPNITTALQQKLDFCRNGMAMTNWWKLRPLTRTIQLLLATTYCSTTSGHVTFVRIELATMEAGQGPGYGGMEHKRCRNSFRAHGATNVTSQEPFKLEMAVQRDS